MHTIQNERLKVTFRYLPDVLFSERFESIGVAEQVCLDGKYLFCEPEQHIPQRPTCNGIGLCGEYVWDALAEEAAPGAYFPKIGVGLLKQRPEGGKYNMWKHYEVQPFPVHAEFYADRAIFTQTSTECLGVATKLTKEVFLQGNALHMHVTLENHGSRVLQLEEYQHNFLCLNGAPVGPGYRLDVPFALSLKGIENRAYDAGNPVQWKSGYLRTEGTCILWNRTMDGHGYHLEIPKEQLDVRKGAYWKLTHNTVPAAITEKITFSPSRLVLWGVEHCICTEVYIPIFVAPGEKQEWERIWVFMRGDNDE